MSLLKLRGGPRAGSHLAARQRAVLAPRRPCAHPGCGVLTVSGICRRHARQREQQRPNAAVRAWYHTPRWRALARRVLAEQPRCDGADCQQSGAPRPATQCDHRQPHRGDPALFWSRLNLHGLCASCHSRKTRAGA